MVDITYSNNSTLRDFILALWLLLAVANLVASALYSKYAPQRLRLAWVILAILACTVTYLIFSLFLVVQ